MKEYHHSLQIYIIYLNMLTLIASLIYLKQINKYFYSFILICLATYCSMSKGLCIR
jgi:hypothetical protein